MKTKVMLQVCVEVEHEPSMDIALIQELARDSVYCAPIIGASTKHGSYCVIELHRAITDPPALKTNPNEQTDADAGVDVDAVVIRRATERLQSWNKAIRQPQQDRELLSADLALRILVDGGLIYTESGTAFKRDEHGKYWTRPKDCNKTSNDDWLFSNTGLDEFVSSAWYRTE